MKVSHKLLLTAFVIIVAPLWSAHALNSQIGNATPIEVSNRPLLYTCTVDATAGTSTCNGVVEKYSGTAQQGTFVVHLDPTQGREVLQTQTTFAQLPNDSAWEFTIGDSSTNDGWGGDGGEPNNVTAVGQENDAELQITGAQGIALYGSDKIDTGYQGLLISDPLSKSAPSTRQIFLSREFPHSNKTVTTTVANEYLDVTLPDSTFGTKAFSSPVLYALCGQPDNQGSVNSDVFVSINKTIFDPSVTQTSMYYPGYPGRLGAGVQKIVFSVYGTPRDGTTMCAGKTYTSSPTVAGADSGTTTAKNDSTQTTTTFTIDRCARARAEGHPCDPLPTTTTPGTTARTPRTTKWTRNICPNGRTFVSNCKDLPTVTPVSATNQTVPPNSAIPTFGTTTRDQTTVPVTTTPAGQSPTTRTLSTEPARTPIDPVKIPTSTTTRVPSVSTVLPFRDDTRGIPQQNTLAAPTDVSVAPTSADLEKILTYKSLSISVPDNFGLNVRKMYDAPSGSIVTVPTITGTVGSSRLSVALTTNDYYGRLEGGLTYPLCGDNGYVIPGILDTHSPYDESTRCVAGRAGDMVLVYYADQSATPDTIALAHNIIDSAHVVKKLRK